MFIWKTIIRFFFLISLFKPFYSYAQFSEDLKGNVKEVESICYEWDGGDQWEVPTASAFNYHYFYDKEGRMLKDIYDENITTFKYTAKKGVLITKTFENKKLERLESERYDDANRLIERKVEYVRQTHPSYLRKLEYNEEGQLIVEKLYGGDFSTLHQTTSYIYDTEGRLFERRIEQTDDCTIPETYALIHYIYKKNKIIQDSYDKNNKALSREIKTLSDELIIKEIYRHPENQIVLRATYILNENGDALHVYWSDWQSERSKLTESDSYTYKYDAHGNWIERKHWSDGQPSSIVIRKINYF